MKLKLIYNSIYLGRQERIVETQSEVSEEDIAALFKLYFSVTYSRVTCKYERMD